MKKGRKYPNLVSLSVTISILSYIVLVDRSLDRGKGPIKSITINSYSREGTSSILSSLYSLYRLYFVRLY